jgi:arylsulfatase A-like enzyme
MVARALMLGVVVAVLALAGSVTSVATAARPNILVVVTDDQRADGTMQVMPQTRDWLESAGTRYDNAWVTTPLCCPSRASILSGRYAHNHGVYFNWGPDRLDDSRAVQRYLDDAGYRTAVIGKYLSERSLAARPGFFDHFETFEGGYVPTRWNLNGRIRTVYQYSTGFIADEAVRFIAENTRERGEPGRTPWFLYLAPSAAHWPVIPEVKYASAPVGQFPATPAHGEADITDKPDFFEDLAAFPLTPAFSPPVIRAAQLRTLMSVDDMIARLRAKLAELGALDDTLVIFTSDNGLLWGEHRGPTIKDLPYPQATRVPLMMSWPGRLPAGAVDRRLVANIDIAPSILAAAGVAPSRPMDGRSLLSKRWKRNRLLLEYFGLDGRIPKWFGLLTRRFEYTVYEPINGDPVQREYYGRASDPFELENVLGNASTADDPPAAKLHRLDRRLSRDVGCAGTGCP